MIVSFLFRRPILAPTNYGNQRNFVVNAVVLRSSYSTVLSSSSSSSGVSFSCRRQNRPVRSYISLSISSNTIRSSTKPLTTTKYDTIVRPKTDSTIRIINNRTKQPQVIQSQQLQSSAFIHNSANSQGNYESNNKHDSYTKSNTTSSTTRILDPLIVCGPSGVGKGTIIERYMREYGGADKFGFTVSHTTRLPRPGEQHGVHYYYVPTIQEMEQLIERNYFIEYAQVHGNYYGTSWQSLLDIHNDKNQQPEQQQQRRALLDIDPQGVQQIKNIVMRQQQQQQQQRNEVVSEGSETTKFIEQYLLRPKYIFIRPPSLEILYNRLVTRGTETPESIERRTANAKNEMEYGLQPGNFDVIVTNDNLQQAVIDFKNAIDQLYELQ